MISPVLGAVAELHESLDGAVREVIHDRERLACHVLRVVEGEHAASPTLRTAVTVILCRVATTS